jgi:hypothetical protein
MDIGKKMWVTAREDLGVPQDGATAKKNLLQVLLSLCSLGPLW